MTCKDVSGMLDRLMDGELTEEEQRELRAHGQTCPDCADEIRAAFEMKALFEEASPEADVPLATQARWRGAIRQAAKADRRKKLTRWISSAAAAVVVLVGVGLALNGSLSPNKDAAPQLAAPIAVQEAAEANEAAEAPAAANEAAEVDSAAEASEAYEAAEAYEEADEAAYEGSPGSGDAYETTDTAGEAEAPMAADAASEAAVIETDGALIGAMEAPVGDFASKSAATEPLADAEPLAEAQEDRAVAAPEAEAAYDEAAEAPASTATPACEYAIQTRSVEIACELIRELAGEFEGTADVQSVEGGSANVYVALNARDAGEFLSGVAKLDDSANPADPPELTGEGTVLVLLVVEPAE